MKTPGKILAEKVKHIRDSNQFAVRSSALPTWCPGCGYFGIHHALSGCLKQMGMPLHEIVVVSGIGCAGRYPFFSNTYGLHTVHGRTLPVATGVKMANPGLTVYAVGGDGDGLAIGGGHLPHVIRRDVNINYLLFDNSMYGLTKGQPSPSSPVGTTTKASPFGTVDKPLNATLMALTYGIGFVARLFAGDPEGMRNAFVEGTRHNGFSLFHIYTTCVTFDKVNKTWDNLKRQIHPLPQNHDAGNLRKAFDAVLDDDFTTGIIFQKESA
ncbi:MAG TPA: thiamine pyrophosphate-dependent enzyme [Desulfomonilaceae bacterium]|nr:thiamine pyrophosphate-dependent enzyme [Desulfomonilaceae bacterium]